MKEEEVVESVTCILQQKKDGGLEPEKLEPFIPHLTLPLINSILSCKTLRSHPVTLLSFFKWLQTHAPPPLRSSPHALLALLPPLLSQRISDAKSLLVSFISSDRSHALHALLVRPHRSLPRRLLDTAVGAYVHAGHPHHALVLFQKMKRLHFTPNLLTCNTLLNALVRSPSSHSTSLAVRVFDEALALGVKPNTNTFNILIYGHCHLKQLDRALALVHRMPEFGCFPDNITYNTILDALCKKGQLSKVREVLMEMKNGGLVPDRKTYNILVHGYCRLKWLKEANEVIDLMTIDGMLPDIWTYNTMIRGLCDEGKSN